MGMNPTLNSDMDIMAANTQPREYGTHIPLVETNWDDPDTDEEMPAGQKNNAFVSLSNQNPLDHLVESIKKESNEKPNRSRSKSRSKSRSRSRSRDRRRRRKRRSDS